MCNFLPVDRYGAVLDVGESGLALAAANPGLRAEVDQHAAAVRDMLAASGAAPDVEGLSAYLKGFADVAEEQRLLTGEWGWQHTRITAVFQLLTEATVGQ